MGFDVGETHMLPRRKARGRREHDHPGWFEDPPLVGQQVGTALAFLRARLTNLQLAVQCRSFFDGERLGAKSAGSTSLFQELE